MAENGPSYPDIGCLKISSIDEDTKQQLLEGTWPLCLQYPFLSRLATIYS